MDGFWLIKKDRRSRRRVHLFETEEAAVSAAKEALTGPTYKEVWVTDIAGRLLFQGDRTD